MNLEKRFKKLHQFLGEHQFLHELEVLERYPDTMGIYEDWIKDLEDLSPDELINFENNPSSTFLKNSSFIDFLDEVLFLQRIPKKDFHLKKIPQTISQKMSLKKQHEISLIKEEINELDIKQLIDIGSGAGHLSSYLLWDSNLKSVCIDQSSEFQEIGKKKLSKYHPQILENIDFETMTFSPSSELSFLEDTMVIGLHACGDLSPLIIDKYLRSKNKFLLNYGCCFHKLTEDYINLSSYAKKNPLKLSNHTLTLAAKGYKPKSKEELNFRDKVKLYRYGLHIYLKDDKDLEFITIGNAQKSDYESSFSDYAFKYAHSHLNGVSRDELDIFISSLETNKKIRRLVLLGIIRSILARLIELYIVIDRALYIQEKGYKVELNETFSKELSPRNLSLMAQKH